VVESVIAISARKAVVAGIGSGADDIVTVAGRNPLAAHGIREGVVAGPAADDLEAGDPVGAVLAADRGSRHEVDGDAQLGCREIEGVGSDGALEDVRLAVERREDDIVAGIAQDDVAPGAVDEHIVAIAALETVIAGLAV